MISLKIRWLLPLFCATALHAAEIRLFAPDGSMLPNYDELASRISPGDTLVFNDGQSYVVRARLGAGYTSQVWSVLRPGQPESYALRLPLRDETRTAFGQSFHLSGYIDQTVDGYAQLRDAGVRTARIHGSLSRQYVLTEEVPHRINAQNFLQFLEQPSRLQEFGVNPAQALEMEDALVRFAGTTTRFSEIGDFNGTQLVYDLQGREWVLLDWTNGHRWSPPRLPDYFTGVFRPSSFNFNGPMSKRQSNLLKRLQASVRSGPMRPSRAGAPSFMGCLGRALRLR